MSAPNDLWKLIDDKPYSVSKIFQMGMRLVGDPQYGKQKERLELLEQENVDLKERVRRFEQGTTSEQVLMQRNTKVNALLGEAKYRIIDLENNVKRLTKLVQEQMKNAD